MFIGGDFLLLEHYHRIDIDTKWGAPRIHVVCGLVFKGEQYARHIISAAFDSSLRVWQYVCRITKPFYKSIFIANTLITAWLDGEPLSCDDYFISVVTKADVEFYSKCPKLEARFGISHNYTGPFELPNIESLGKFTSGYLGPKLSFSDRVDDAVTSVSMPDLEKCGSMLFGWLNNLTSISLP